ncbi:MAG TPA: hypothetical protein VGO60_05655 [Iamia sp.]|jgi:hypothetical protein|nr:hypothetical protein [Iamia sp.]
MGNGAHDPSDLDALAATVDRLASALADVQAENGRLRRRIDALESVPAATVPAAAGPDGRVDDPPARMDRRRLLRDGLVAGAAATAAVVATGPPAAAANNDPLVLGSPNNLATSQTALTISGTPAGIGLGVTDNTYQGVLPDAAVFAHSKDQAFNIGLAAIAQGTGTAIRATSEGGVGVLVTDTLRGVSVVADEIGLFTSAGTIGVDTSGLVAGVRTVSGRTHIAFGTGGRDAPTGDAFAHVVGDLVATQAGELWCCVVSGTPGTWRKLASPQASGALHVLPAPVRIYDSRPGTQPGQSPKTPLSPNVSRFLDLKVNGSTVPSGATAALVTVLLVNAAAANGNFTIWANGRPRPLSNTMVWGGDSGRFTATAVTGVDASALCQVNASHQTNLVLDVVGYYR